MRLPPPSVIVASFFGAGFAPRAPGTVGTAAAMPLAWALTQLPLVPQLAVVALVTVIGMVAAHDAGRHLGVVDAKQIVIDEVAGILVTFVWVPFSLPNAIAGFALFRLFDIVKPWPASFFDRKVKNGAGVVLDDVVAGLFARGVLALLALLFPAFIAR